MLRLSVGSFSRPVASCDLYQTWPDPSSRRRTQPCKETLMCIHSCNELLTLKNSGHWTHPGNPLNATSSWFSVAEVGQYCALRNRLLAPSAVTQTPRWRAVLLDHGGDEREQESPQHDSWSKRRVLGARISAGQHESFLCIHCKLACLTSTHLLS